TFLSRRFNFSREDEIAIVFCGSKKSLATGVPMAQVIFSASAIGPALLPIMIFHQIQLMACAMMANRYALQFEAESDSATTAKYGLFFVSNRVQIVHVALILIDDVINHCLS